MSGAMVISDDLVLSFQDIDIKIIRPSLFLEREDWSSDFHRLGAFLAAVAQGKLTFAAVGMCINLFQCNRKIQRNFLYIDLQWFPMNKSVNRFKKAH